MRTPDGHNLRVVLKIAKDEKGGLSATLYNLDQNGPPMAGSLVSFERGTVRFVNDFPRLTYEGKMSADGNSISGAVAENGSCSAAAESADGSGCQARCGSGDGQADPARNYIVHAYCARRGTGG